MAGVDPVTLWHSGLSESPLTPEAFLARVRASGALYGEAPVCVHRRPFFVRPAQLRRLRGAVSGLHGCIRAVTSRMLDEGLSGPTVAALGLDPARLALAAIDPGYRGASVLARLDCFFDGDTPRFLELNGESPAGMGYADALAEVFRRDPLMAGLPGARALPATDAAVAGVLDTWRAWRVGRGRPPGGRPTVAIVDDLQVPTAPEFALFQRRFEAAGVRCLVADARELSFDGRLRAGGEVIDVVYRRLLVADMLARPGDCAALLEAYRAGEICLVNSLRTVLLHGKGLFALLHAPGLQPWLTARQRAAVAAHVPWTAIVSPKPGPCTPPDLLPRALADRERLVLKPLHGHGGEGVVLGWRATALQWVAGLSCGAPQVVQVRVTTTTDRFPDAREDYALRQRVVDLSPFLVRGRLAGLLCRLSESELANVSAGGATQTAVFVL